ncbi:MAG TPA: DUF1549 domain-containing protein, partial [Bryobacteraceae bacterium]|nr:DUF1549 domain-containing protein [Bryobacteraceae bacterium]
MTQRIWFVMLVAPYLVSAETGFNREIRPILSDKCFACHGPDAAARKIRLRLDSEAASRADLGGRFAIVPGDSGRSELVKRVTAPNPGLRMPPAHTGVKLSDREINALRSWIDEGAKWQKHWAFIPPQETRLPEVKNKQWARNGIDYFVLERLEREGMQPSPEAAKITLLRRVHFDLTGLPPTIDEVDGFVKDNSPDAYEKVVDRLLKSPRYGEKMAIRWLDAARYADTNGYQTDAERHMWRWRDWVIESFNRNLPYDQFALQQIAGDLLPNATLDQKIATGFNRNHRGNSEGGIVPEEYLAEYAVDRVETFSTVFLGLTVGCARCHNHKYDPFTQREFYQFFAYFNNIPELGRYLKYGNTPPLVKAPVAEQQARIRELDAVVALSQQALMALDGELRSAQLTWEKALTSRADWMPVKGMVAHVPDAALAGATFIDAGDKGAFGFYDRFTVSAWIRSSVPNGAIITRAVDDADGEGWGLYLIDGKLQANLIKRRLDDSIRLESKDTVPLS